MDKLVECILEFRTRRHEQSTSNLFDMTYNDLMQTTDRNYPSHV